VTPAPSDPQRSIEVIERAAPKAIPEDSVWAGLAEPTSPRETAAPPPKDPEPRADSRDRVVEARTEFSWVWSLLVSLIELARSWLP
jgi:hypothetical protein